MQPITAAQAAAPRDGLAGAVGLGVVIPDDDPLDPGNDWPRGFNLEGIACHSGYVTDPGCESGGNGRTWRRRWTHADLSTPFYVGAGVECSTMGGDLDLERWNREAGEELERVQWAQIARELWTGELSTNHQRLASPEATVLSEEPVTPTEAIGALEDAMAGCQLGQPDLIHVPRKATAYLADRNLALSAQQPTARLFTPNGSLVIADRGYTGSGPHDEAPTASVVWFYATGVLSARLGDVSYAARQIEEAVDAETNDMRVRAERPVGVGWLCCHYAIPVCLTAT